jgi:hypothetical protein
VNPASCAASDDKIFDGWRWATNTTNTKPNQAVERQPATLPFERLESAAHD